MQIRLQRFLGLYFFARIMKYMETRYTFNAGDIRQQKRYLNTRLGIKKTLQWSVQRYSHSFHHQRTKYNNPAINGQCSSYNYFLFFSYRAVLVFSYFARQHP